ncbi:hypothetical protein COBT_004221, partial [Conglomerata obtusa]
MWEKTLKSSNNHKIEEYVYESIDTHENISKFPSFNEFANIIKILPNWKSAGSDGIYNFFIKYLPSTHKALYSEIEKICLNQKQQEKWFYTGITYLIPKSD